MIYILIWLQTIFQKFFFGAVLRHRYNSHPNYVGSSFVAERLNAHGWVRPIICLSCQFPVFLSNSSDLAVRPACPEEHFRFPHSARGIESGEG